MKLSNLVAGAAALALVAGAGSSAFATPTTSQTTTFTINGSVDAVCSVSFPSTTVALGNIQIDESAAGGYATLFHMTTFASGLVQGQGGCNTNNNATLTETNSGKGLHNGTTVGYDSSFFTPDLPYNAEAVFFEGACSTSGPTTGCQPGVVAAPGVGTATQENGASSSTITFSVYVPQAAKGLLAGTYADTVTYTLAVAM